MGIFNKFKFEEEDSIQKRAIINISHFNNTRAAAPDNDGFYPRKSQNLLGIAFWTFKTTSNKSGRFLSIKDNGNGTFSTKGSFFQVSTYAWEDLVLFR